MSGDKKSVSRVISMVRRRVALRLRNDAGFALAFKRTYTSRANFLSSFPSPGGMPVHLDPDFSPLV